MPNYYLSIDIGASSGRHILFWMEDGKIKMEEVHRFANEMKKENGHLVWDTHALFEEIIAGMANCKALGKVPVAMGIDTWGVDYVLLDYLDVVVGRTYGYRDHRTENADRLVESKISAQELYRRTGIQKQPFNTIYQLMALKEQEPEMYEKANTLLMLPDYFNFLLTGKKKTEYTNATTTQLVNAQTGTWDAELLSMLGIKSSLFTPICEPGTKCGDLLPSVVSRVGYETEVYCVTSHDTASAVAAVPALKDDFVYISSGTWSLMGVELKQANCSKECAQYNFTNEGGIEYRYRFLKNIMGLWMIQSVKKEFPVDYFFGELCKMAEEAKDFPSRVNVNDSVFLAPENMIEAVKAFCRDSGQKVPETPGEISTVIYQSLAESYGDTIAEIERLTNRHYESINIVGGGSYADYLCQLTANATKRTVYAGPSEATAIGNGIVQMIATHVFENLQEARKCVFDSFELMEYKPQ